MSEWSYGGSFSTQLHRDKCAVISIISSSFAYLYFINYSMPVKQSDAFVRSQPLGELYNEVSYPPS